MKAYLPFFQIGVAIFLIILILLQQRGSAFGEPGGFYSTRRGIQKKIFWAAILFGFLFIALALLNLVL